MQETIGDKIKYLRKEYRISQEALAYNLCSQSEISRIEGNKHFPSYYLLIKIADRLGVDINYFLDEGNSYREDYIAEVREQLKLARRKRDYKTIYEIVKVEEKNPLFRSNEKLMKYLSWNKGITQYHYLDDSVAAIKTLKSCLSNSDINKVFTGQDIHILNSLGIVFRNEKQLVEARGYLEKAYNMIKINPQILNDRIKLKVMYNLSKVYTDLQEEIKSLELCQKGISICKRNDNLFLFADFHYQIGRNYLLTNHSEKGLNYFQKAKNIFELEGKNDLANLISREINIFIKSGVIS